MGRACRAASARGEGGYGSAASRVPARQRSFPYPAFRPQNDCQPDRAMDEQPLHLERGMTHDALKRYLESAPSLAELASVLLPGVDSDSLIDLHAGCAQIWQASWRGEGGYGIELLLELLRAVGGYDTAAEKGTAPWVSAVIYLSIYLSTLPGKYPKPRPCPSNAQIRLALNFLHAAAATTTARPHPVGRVSARLPRSLCLSHARTKPRARTARQAR